MKNSNGSTYTVKPLMQDTTLTNVDELVTKINLKYPTVAESYIKMLLKKYYLILI